MSALCQEVWIQEIVASSQVARGRPADAAIAAGLENGALRPIVGKELPLKDAPQAHFDVMAPGAFGKIVLIP